MSEEQVRRAPAPPDVHDEERLAALDDLSGEPGPEGFAAAVDEIVSVHTELLARLAQ